MNDPELQSFENELRKLSPARPPEQLLDRLYHLQPRSVPSASPSENSVGPLGAYWPRLLRWLVPSAGVALVALAALWQMRPVPQTRPQTSATSTAYSPPETTALAAPDDPLKIAHKLLAAYEAVAEVPGNGPVRFRCFEWEDRLMLRDPARGIAIEQRTPRFEIIPVAFESY